MLTFRMTLKIVVGGGALTIFKCKILDVLSKPIFISDWYIFIFSFPTLFMPLKVVIEN